MSPSLRLLALAVLLPKLALAEATGWEGDFNSVVQVEASSPGSSMIGSGSGVVIAPGRIITNEHVVAGRTKIQIRSGPHGKFYPAWVLYRDHARDLAVLMTSAPLQPIPVAPEESFLMDRPVRIVGFPGGQPKITTGSITALLRRKGCLVIQTDAPMAPGNSGGAMLDEEGRLLGISTQEIIFPENGTRMNEAVHVHEALQLAGLSPKRTWASNPKFPPPSASFPPSSAGNIPSRRFPWPEPRTSRPPPVADELPGSHEESEAPPVFVPEASVYIGPRLSARVEKCFNVFGTLGNAGLKVIRMDPGGAAECGGLRLRDEILTMNDLPIGTALNFTGLLQKMPPGTRVVFQILREGLFREVAVVLGGNSTEAAVASASGPAAVQGQTGTTSWYHPPQRDPRRLGVTVAISSLPAVHGLEITSVVPGGSANYARLRSGDVITGLNGKEPGSPYDFVLRLHSFRAGTPVQLQVHRQGKTETVTAVIQGG